MKIHNSVVIFDFETTGLSSIKNEILEIGAVRLELINNKYEIVDKLEVILNTNEEISETITKITGITKELQLKEGISQEEGFYLLNNLISDDSLLVAYNIQFDLGFLESFYRKNFDPSYEVKNDCLDVMAIYKDRHRFPHRLESAVEKYNIEEPNTHRALDDVYATYAVLLKLQEELPNIKSYVNVVGYNPKYGVNGKKLPQIRYVAQYGGRREIENLIK